MKLCERDNGSVDTKSDAIREESSPLTLKASNAIPDQARIWNVDAALDSTGSNISDDGVMQVMP